MTAVTLPAPNEYPGRVESLVEGGHATLTTSRLGEALNFSPAGKYLSGGSISDLKFPDLQPFNPHTMPPYWYFCRTGNPSECMTKSGDLRNEQMQSITLQSEVTYVGTKSAALLAPQAIELHPSGAFKSAVISTTGHFAKQDGTVVNFGPGETGKLNADGYLI